MSKPAGSAFDLIMKDTGLGYALSIIGGKYKMIILFCLFKFEVMRFNELKRMIDSISFKTLSSTLKEMEVDELIIRTEYPQVPPKVEYCLSPKGHSLIPVLQSLCAWGAENSGGRVSQTPIRFAPA